jgi:hypothetical protein
MTEPEGHADQADAQQDQCEEGRAGVERGEPGGRAARDAGARSVPVDELPPEVRDRLSDELIDELLAGARTEEEIVGPRRAAGRSDAPAREAAVDRAPGL